jgi:chromosome segregation protein
MARFLKLERMEIHGFKSFYGRTRFDFPDGITAVVGPNGCGKSNIGDAISWVLGEQRASSLRSQSMEDVIFNGSQGRKPLGMAEVSLHFRNIHPRGTGDCGRIDLDAPEGAVVVLPTAEGADFAEPGQALGNDHTNGNGHSNGNGHGVLAAAVEAETAVPGPPPAEALLAEAAAASADAAAAEAPDTAVIADAVVADAAAADAADADAETPGHQAATRFFLEDLPEEVVVTRRLYRSGESEYALNGQRCRLRDVQDLLSRTEIGTRLYTTIEQGKIDHILIAKPKERRLIIEEAAGILGYKTKRRQTEQKLEATQANLLRIADIAAEVDKQIQSLRRQAAKARRYRRLMDALRERRATLFFRRLQQIDAGLAESGQALDAKRAEDAAAAAERARAEADLEALRQRLEEAENEARGRRDQIHALDMEIDRLQERLRSGEEQGRDLQARVADALRDIASIDERAAEASARGVALQLEFEAAAGRVHEAEASQAEIETERAAAASAIAESERDLDAARQALLSLLDEVGTLGQRRAALEEQARAADASIERLGRERDEAIRSLEASATAVEELRRETAGLRTAVEERAAAHAAAAGSEKEAAARLDETAKRLEEQRGRGKALRERLQSLEELEARHEGVSRGVVDLLGGAGGFAPHGVIGESIDVPAGLEKAVAAALGPIQDALAVASRGDAARGVAFLRAHGAGRGAFVPAEARGGALPGPPLERPGVTGVLADTISGLDPDGAVAALLSRTLLAVDLASALEAQPLVPGFSLVTPEGERVDADGIVYGGDGPELLHGVLARRAERVTLARQAEECDALCAAVEDEVRVLGARTAEARGHAAACDASFQEEQRALFQADLRLQQREAERGRLEGAIPLLQSEADRLRRDQAQRAADRDAVKGALEAREADRLAAEQAIHRKSSEVALKRVRLDEIQRRSAEARAAVAAGHQRLAALARERDAVSGAEHELRQRQAERQTERSEAEARVASLGRQDEELNAQRATAQAARAEAAARDEAALAGLAYDRSLHHAREQAAKDGRALLDAVRQAIQELEIRRARLQNDLEHLEISCRDDLNLTLEALRTAPPVLDEARTLEMDEDEVAKTRAALDAIGPVNLMAIEQCAELEERFNFLDTQKRDLEASIESLRDTIRRINRESRQRFLLAFESIQAGFKVAFESLFGGGRAELTLVEGEDDVLEAGIDIAAQPPGKRLQSLALLSGGEKALTAVALLFALFRYRPSPFCVLDEVDAPLDEANVERFTRLLRDQTSETQFILITHNRKSMEAANLLYGVTMEEPGVSKVLPLRFE